ncbi:MAG TPA: Gfo/Idh/MocA family oxidoreductase [Gaiellaceae bacterium]|nr:Gfo/Idh/MocA family oxidoreductase [Gaiellaceae bacterium]
MSVRFGILSTARINRLVLAGARESDRVEIAAVASRDFGRAEAYAREQGIERAYGSYEELLADPDVDAVYNPLPNSMHVDWSIRALEAGKHVLCEKPLSRRPEDVERAFDAADGAGLLLTEAFMYRHNPQTARLKELVEGGAIGEPRVVRAAFSFTISDDSNIRLAADLDGGALMDVGCYCVSGSRLLAGEPERVYGIGVVEAGVDTVFAGTLEFAGGVLGQFDCGFRLPMRDELEVVGSEGSLFLDDPWHCRRPVIELRPDGGEVEEIALEPVDSYRRELENLAGAIRGEAELLLGREDGLGQARAIDALYRSAETGQPVSP